MAELETITIGELPTITEIGENDTVLIASGGRMKKANPSLVGGGGVFVVTASYSGDPEGSYTITFDKTFAEIEEAFIKGAVVLDNTAQFAFFGADVPSGTTIYSTLVFLTYDLGGRGYIISDGDDNYHAETKTAYPSLVVN